MQRWAACSDFHRFTCVVDIEAGHGFSTQVRGIHARVNEVRCSPQIPLFIAGLRDAIVAAPSYGCRPTPSRVALAQVQRGSWPRRQLERR